jgi:hypothetical protein
LILDLCKRNILDLGNDFQVYCMLWCSVSRSHSNINDSFPVTMQSREMGLSW